MNGSSVHAPHCSDVMSRSEDRALFPHNRLNITIVKQEQDLICHYYCQQEERVKDDFTENAL